MKYCLVFLLLFLNLGLNAQNHGAPSPIPVEVMLGSNGGSFIMIVDKRLGPESPFKFFNLLTYEVDNNDFTPDNYIILSIAFFEFLKGFDAGLGANLKAHGGFKPVASLRYTNFSPNWGIIVQPAYELHRDGEFSTLAIVEWHPANEHKFQPYFKVQGLTSWGHEHAFSQHLWRLGAQYRNFRFGPALNVQYAGPEKISSLNWGGFLSVLLF